MNVAEDVLFVGLGTSTVAWYRCYQPAMALGCDWVGLDGEPPDVRWRTGLTRAKSEMPDFGNYKVLVLQQPRGFGWHTFIREAQKRGIICLYEIDDYLHGIRKMPDHDFAKHFGKEKLAKYELCMKACDGIICSTEYIASRYAAFNRNAYVCENGLDVKRYALTLPERSMVNIGWAGATGHQRAIEGWLDAVRNVMRRHDNTCFVTIGQPYADALKEEFPERSMAVPFTAIEQYPSAMTLMDIALAPAGKGNFFRGKSDLRWLEAGALGVPVIADPTVYPAITPGFDGFWASTPDEVEAHLERLVTDSELRTRVGGNAKRYVHESRDISVMAKQWEEVFADVD